MTAMLPGTALTDLFAPADLPGREYPACAHDENKDAWFPFTEADLVYAQTVCADCPIRAACEQVGRSRREIGVWGGLYMERGVPMLLPAQRRRAGRPAR